MINAYREGGLVSKRIQDICASVYPHEKITLYVINDGADSGTGEAARRALVECQFRTQLIEPSERFGKTVCQNRVIAQIEDEYIVFTDADITTEPDALVKLISWLEEDGVGAVCADVRPVGANVGVTSSEIAYRSVYGRMCVYDSSLDSTCNFNGPLLAFRKSAVPSVNAVYGADDANLAFECIKNGYSAKYVADAVAYELQPKTRGAQFRQKIRRADGLVNSVRLFKKAGGGSERTFWRVTYPMRKYMLLTSPVLLIISVLLLVVGCYLVSFSAGLVATAVLALIIVVSFAKPANLFGSFVVNQLFLAVGLMWRKNIQQWNRVDK